MGRPHTFTSVLGFWRSPAAHGHATQSGLLWLHEREEMASTFCLGKMNAVVAVVTVDHRSQQLAFMSDSGWAAHGCATFANTAG